MIILVFILMTFAPVLIDVITSWIKGDLREDHWTKKIQANLQAIVNKLSKKKK